MKAKLGHYLKRSLQHLDENYRKWLKKRGENVNLQNNYSSMTRQQISTRTHFRTLVPVFLPHIRRLMQVSHVSHIDADYSTKVK